MIRATTLNVLFAALVMVTIVSTGQSQSNRSAICDIERASKSQFPHWKLDSGHGWKEFLAADWSYEEAFVSLQGQRNFDGPAAAQKELTEISETISNLMTEAGVEFSTIKIAGLAEDNQLWTGHYEENTIIVLREGNLVLQVEASSTSAAIEFARFIVSQLRNPTSACRGLVDDSIIPSAEQPGDHLCNVRMAFTVQSSMFEMIRHARHEHPPPKPQRPLQK